ncbi:MAG: protein kinase domain-containing protein [Planctomycetota bacterium]
MHPEAAVLQFFRAYEADLVSGSVRTVDEYAAAIPEHAVRIRAEYRRLTEDDSAAGDRVLGGRYLLVESLGRGSFGEVFLAEDTKLRRRVAVKVLDEFRALSAEWRHRLIREAEATQRIGDDGCCTVHDVGFEGDVPFLVMPWIQGQSLDRIFSTNAALGQSPVKVREGLAPAEVLPAFLGLIEKVARTLHAAHRGGVIHRDIKPANVLVRSGGRPILIDFGLAWLDDTDGRATRSATFGTPAYSAPEVRAGELERPDPRVDVFSLGVVLYEGLRGERPFSTAIRQGARLHADRPPPRLDDRYGADVQAVIEAALAPDPAHRYPDMLAFANDLARLQRGESVSVRPAGRIRRAIGWVRRRPLAVGTGALLLALLGVGITALVYARERAVLDSAVVAVAESLDDLAENLTERGKLGMTTQNRLEDARSTLEIARRLSARFGSGPAIDRSLSRILVVLAETEILVGDMEDAEAKLREALLLLDRVEEQGLTPTRQDRERRSHALILIGDTMTRRNQLPEALSVFSAALAIDERLWRECPNEAKYASDVGFGYLRIGSCNKELGDSEGSRARAEQAMEALLRAEALEPSNASRSLHVAEVHRTIAAWNISVDPTCHASMASYVFEALDRQEAWTARYPADSYGWRQLMLTVLLGMEPDMPLELRERCVALASRCAREILSLSSNVPIDLCGAAALKLGLANLSVSTLPVEEVRELVADGLSHLDQALSLAPDELQVQRAAQGLLTTAAKVCARIGDGERAETLEREAVEAVRREFEATGGSDAALVLYVKRLKSRGFEHALEEARRVLRERRARPGELSEELAEAAKELLAEDR